jgi:hypothetical protein
VTRPTLLLVHGMGAHPPGAMTAAFTEALDSTLQRFPDPAQTRIADHVDIHEIAYDGTLDTVRRAMAERTRPIAERLAGLSLVFDLPLGELVHELTDLETRFGDDEFLFTHVLDVVFYGSVLGEKIRVDVARELAGHIEDAAGDVHVVAHSLGTAVVHDTLALLYRPGADAADGIPDLDPLTHRLRSVTMIANVSRLVNRVTRRTDPLRSIVRPTPDGCTAFFTNVRHELDPFTWIEPFDPPDDGSWIPPDEYAINYAPIVTTAITEPDTHALGAYVRNPEVARGLLADLLGYHPDDDTFRTVREAFDGETIPGAYQALNDALRAVDLSDASTLTRLARVGRHFHRVIEEFRAGLGGLTP